MKLTRLRQKQAGSVLLVMMLVLVVSSSYVLVSKLNANTRQYTRQSSSLSVLNDAKTALIGYAVNYPENSVNGAPGTLPCPDINNDGSAVGNCSYPNTSIGRFPWSTLEMEKTRDYSGEVLWYVVADNFRTPQVGQINSDTAGNLGVDGNGDVVAIIISPGYPFAGQDRPGDPLDEANFLEGDNADADADYVTRAAGEFNDTLVTITRQELMHAVEKRVLGDVSQALLVYQGESPYPPKYSAFPWLAPFSDSSTSAFRGQSGTDEGHIPYHWGADPDSIAIPGSGSIVGRNPFSTNIAITWNNITGASTSTSNPLSFWGFNTVSATCLNDINDCDEGGIYAEIVSLSPATAIDCTWSNRDSASCAGFTVSTAPVAYTQDVNCPAGTLTRTYTINFPAFTGTVAITNPTTISTRLRSVSLTAANPSYLPAQLNVISISDVYAGALYFFGTCIGPLVVEVGTGISSFDADTEGIIAVNGIQYDVDIDDGELPSWFVSNGWQNLIYVSYASGEALPGDTTDILPGPPDGNPDNACVVGTNCLTVDADGQVSDNVRAVAISAGVRLPLVNTGTRPSANLDNYFEVENSVVDDFFMKDKITGAKNDQTRIIATAP